MLHGIVASQNKTERVDPQTTQDLKDLVIYLTGEVQDLKKAFVDLGMAASSLLNGDGENDSSSINTKQ